MPFTELEQADAAARVRQTRCAHYFVNHSKKTCAIIVLFPLLAIGIIVATRSFNLDDPSGEDYFVRDDIRSRLDDARLAARDDFPFQSVQLARADETPAFALEILLRSTINGQVPTHDQARDAPNVLTRQSLAMLKRAEDAVFLDSNFQRFCLFDPQARDCDGEELPCVFPSSILNSPHLYGKYTEDERLCGREPGSEPVSEEAFERFLESLVVERDGERVINSAASGFLTVETSPEKLETWAVRSRLRAGMPFEGFQLTDENIVEQEKAYDEWAIGARDTINELSTEETDIFLVGIRLGNSAFGEIAVRDLTFSVAALVLVFILIWIHTGSAFLSGTAMAQIFLSFPVAYIFYRFVFQQRYFAALQILAIFLLLGIGADDVFVFTDAWKQAAVVLGKECDYVTRMSWTYRRAVRAMSVTSFTTACAFFVTATSPIMPVGTLGIWAGLLIVFQFFLVITMYPCAVAIWERFWRRRLFVRGFKKPAPEEAEYELNLPFYQRFLPKKWRSKRSDAAADYRPIERFFRGPWLRFLFKFRYILVVLAAVLAGASIYFATRLKPPTDTEEFLPASHPLSIAFDTLAKAFPTTQADQQLRVRVTWGILDVDREGTSKFEPSQRGKPILDDEFDLRSAAAQRHLLQACKFFEENTELIFEGDTIDDTVRCWIRDYRNWVTTNENRDDFTTFDTHAELADELIRFATFEDSDGLQPYITYLQDQDIAFNNDKSQVVFTELRFVSSTEAAVPESVMWPVYQRWQALLTELNSNGPAGMNQAFATGGVPWKWQITQRTLVKSMFVGIGVMLAVAFGALTVTTLNWVIGMITTIMIAGIVSMQIGLISLLGWELGITETVGVVISIGYSFDGAAHIATAYVESRSNSRYDRTRDALTDLGISILFGAVSTLAAGIMLFPAVITFFVKFAGLIVITVSLSLIWSLTFLPSLLLIAGPTGEFGSLAPHLRWIARCFVCFKKPREEDKLSQSDDDFQAGAEVGKDQDQSFGEESASSEVSSMQITKQAS